MKLVITILFLLPYFLRADQSVTLQWEPNPEPDIASYAVYWGLAPRSYPNVTNVGNVTIATVYGLPEGRTHYFAITARSASGLESDFSNEVTNAIPALVIASRPRKLVIKTGIERATSLASPWEEILATRFSQELCNDTNYFYRVKQAQVEPPTP